MSKLLGALKQIDAKSAVPRQSQRRSHESPPSDSSGAAIAVAPESALAGQSTAPAADDTDLADDEHFDPLARIRELNRLLEEALASRRTAAGEQSNGGADEALGSEAADARAAENDNDSLGSVAPAQASAAELTPRISIAAEFADLADRLLAEISATSPAVVTVVATGPESASSHWLEPLAVALLEKEVGRLLLIEADSDQPQWPTRFGLECSAGLVEVLQSRATWRDCLRPTAIPRLDLLPRGHGTLPNVVLAPAPLLALLNNVRIAYPLILIAAGSIDRPAAAAIAGRSDGVILVVGLKSTPRTAAERAKRILVSSGARILGAIARG